MFRSLPWEFWGMLISSLVLGGIWFERWRQMDIKDSRENIQDFIVAMVYLLFAVSFFHLIGLYDFVWE